MAEKNTLYLYNTLTGRKDAFAPISDDAVRMYSCGPTVYSTAHIGNLRAYIFMDTLRRVLKRNGYKLRHAMNITDVGHLVSDEDTGEDKMIKGAREQSKTPWEIAAEYTKIFMDDIASLNIGVPEIVCPATEHIPQMLKMVEKLVDKGFAYEISDGIYYDVSKFPGYGMLSGKDRSEQLAGARIDVNTEKRNPEDFALWIKAPKEHIMQWESRWGMGYPGWHIECSAMSMYYLGDRIDIHTGGIDHVPIHHENEIAQSDACAGHRVVDRWLHGEFLMVDNGKMSKSLGNVYKLSDLNEKSCAPLSFRYFCLNGHYRNKLNFTWDGIKAASVAYGRFVDGALAHKTAVASSDADTQITDDIEDFRHQFDAAVNDDLNIAKALGIAWQVIRRPDKNNAYFLLLLDMDTVFGLGLAKSAENDRDSSTDVSVSLPDAVISLTEERAAARAAKDFKKSDELREKIIAAGYSVIDTKDGQKLTPIYSQTF